MKFYRQLLYCACYFGKGTFKIQYATLFIVSGNYFVQYSQWLAHSRPLINMCRIKYFFEGQFSLICKMYNNLYFKLCL